MQCPLLHIPSQSTSILSGVFKFLKLNIALYLSNKFRLSFCNICFNKVTSLSCEGGAGSTQAYGFSDTFSNWADSASHFSLPRASWQVSATSITGSFAYSSRISLTSGDAIAPRASPEIKCMWEEWNSFENWEKDCQLQSYWICWLKKWQEWTCKTLCDTSYK